MARSASDLPAGSAIVVTNPDEDCSPPAFRALKAAVDRRPAAAGGLPPAGPAQLEEG